MSNIRPASRVEAITEYYFSRKLAEVARLNAEGRDIISLGIGGPDCPPSDEVIATMCEGVKRSDTHGYQPFGGLPELRQAWATWYARHYGVMVSPTNELQPLIGSKEGVVQVSLAFLNPGDGVLVPNPGYITYSSAARIAQAEIFAYDLTADNGWLPDFDALERLPLDRVKLMWVNYPNMPTGTPASRELFERLIDFGRRHDIVIAHDNPYSFILNDTPMSIMQVEGAKEIAIELNSLSKSHNMAGWRMGVVISNPTFISWIVKVKSNVDSGMFRPAMLAATKALAADDEWYRKINRTYAERRVLIEQIMETLGCTFDPAQRGLFLWGRIPESVESVESFADDVLYNARVFITPGSIFGSNGNRYVRLSLCAPVARLDEALQRIKQWNENR